MPRQSLREHGPTSQEEPTHPTQQQQLEQDMK